MPHLTGFFAEFPDLDKVNEGDIASWIKSKPESHVLLNFFGNRILYPQTIAQNAEDLEIDFAILREAVKQKPDVVYDFKSNRILLPQLYLDRFPPLPRLAGAIIEALSPRGVTKIYLKDKMAVKLCGTLICPPDLEKVSQSGSVKIEVNGVAGSLKLNTLSISKISGKEVKIKIADKDYSVNGGVLGVIIDLRTKTLHE